MASVIIPQAGCANTRTVPRSTIDRSPFTRAHLQVPSMLMQATLDTTEGKALRLARGALLMRADHHVDTLRDAGCLLHIGRA